MSYGWQGTLPGISGTAFARAVGTSYRVVDYWCRTAVLCPSLADAVGSGSQRRYSDEDVALGRVLVAVGQFGKNRATLNLLVDALRPLPLTEWAGRAVVVPAAGAAIVVDDLIDAVLAMEADAMVGAVIVRLDAVLEPEDVQ